MANPVFKINIRLNKFVKRLSEKQGYGLAPAVVHLLESLIHKGINRMQTMQVLEREEKIRLAEDNLRRLIRSMGEYSVEHDKFPIIDDECFQFAFKKLSPIWPSVKEPLIKTGRIKLRYKMIKVKAGNERNSRAIAKFSNAEIDYFGLKLIVHVLIRGSLA